jgi:microsomal dipeptidase-like Zn-dependent dipeptidase
MVRRIPLACCPSSSGSVDSPPSPFRRRVAVVIAAAMLGAAALGVSSAPASAANNLTTSANPVSGYADLHAHQFANLGFGGLLLWGEPFHENGIEWALPWSDFMPAAEGEVVAPNGSPVGRFACGEGLLSIGYPECPPQCPPGTGDYGDGHCLGVAIHGAGGLGDLLNFALSGSIGHKVGGFPEFDGWPRWNMYTAQQMYVDWLERSWRGGQRLMVMLAVNNETLCKLVNRRASFGCDDMPAVDRQIQAAKNLEDYVDRRDDGARNNSGWYRIAYTSGQARALIASGKLAVVLGTEVPSLFGCKPGACDEAYVQSQLDHYYNLGVRHVFPVHNTDNAFGGTALYNDLFAFNNKVITGSWWNIENCSDPGITFHVGAQSNPLFSFLAALAGDPIPPAPAGSSCNTRGLTTLGASFLNKLMAKKMIIDLDHMSTRMINSALDQLEAAQYPAVAMSHSGFRAMALPGGEAAHEGNKTDQQLARIRNLGGIVATIFHQGGRGDVRQYTRNGGTPVPFSCGGSSEAFAQMYLHAVERMQGRAVAFGSDFNGLAGMPSPRFGSEACGGDHPSGYSPSNPVPYPFTAPSGVQLNRQVVGNQTFDYNDDGLANAGMIPDFIQDLKQVGVSQADLAPLMNSAEQYVRMWELAEDTTPPTISCPASDGQWHAEDVTITCTASDAVAGLADASDASFTLSTSVPPDTETANAETNSRVICDSRDNCATAGPIGGNKVDKKTPEITIVSPEPKTYTTGVHLEADYGCTDAGSGPAACGGPVIDGGTIDTTAVGARTFTVSAADAVGNASTKSVDYVIAYGICPLYDATKSKPAGSVVPLKLQLCSSSGANLSAHSIVANAIGLSLTSTEVLGPVEDAGNANPDSNFRFDPSLGASGGYIYNLSTNGMSTGTWALRFRATGDPTVHRLEFQLK